MGHVNGLEKYECVSWKVFMTLSSIDDGSVWWSYMDGIVRGACLASGFMQWLIRRCIYVVKSRGARGRYDGCIRIYIHVLSIFS